MPKRTWSVVIVSHCLLNTNSRAYGLVVSELSNLQLSLLMSHLLRKGYGIFQLPCPEASFIGFRREPLTKTEYEELGLRIHAEKLASEVLGYVNLMIDSGIKIVALIGVAGSPSCGIYTTHIRSRSVRELGKGIFMEELLKGLPENVKLLEWDFRTPVKSLLNIIEKL